MTPDLSEFESDANRGGIPCWHATLDLTPERSASLEAALATKRISGTKISKTVTAWGHPVGPGAVYNHRSGKCRCAR